MSHQVIIDNVDMFEFSVSTKYLLQIFLRRVETETKHTQDITGTRVELRRRGGGREARGGDEENGEKIKRGDTVKSIHYSKKGTGG